MKAFITKYALTDGIKEVDDAIKKTDSMIHVPSIHNQAYFHGQEWHESLESAKAKAENMRIRKLVLLSKQIAKLDNLTF